MKQTKRNDQKRWLVIKNIISHLLCVLCAVSLMHFLFLEWPQLHCLKSSHFYFKAKFTLACSFSKPFLQWMFLVFCPHPLCFAVYFHAQWPDLQGSLLSNGSPRALNLLCYPATESPSQNKSWDEGCGTERLVNWHPSGCRPCLLSITLMPCSAGMFPWDNFEAYVLLCFLEFSPL